MYSLINIFLYNCFILIFFLNLNNTKIRCESKCHSMVSYDIATEAYTLNLLKN